MFVNKNYQTSNTTEREKRMATKELTKPVNHADKIGQMYEERKKDGTTGRIGVIEEVNDKFRTFMMRDVDGNSFNITFATLKSGWRKYQGDVVIQTAEQKAEAKQEKAIETQKKQNREASAKKVLEDVGEKPKISREDKVKAVSALKVLIENAVIGVVPDARVAKTTRSSVKVYYKNHILMGAYVRPIENRYTFDTTSEIAELIHYPGIKVDKIVNEEWHISTKFRFSQDDIDAMLNIFVNALTGYVLEKYIKPEQNKKSKKEKNEENEKTEEEN